MPPAPAELVENEIPGDFKQPGGEFRGGFVARCAFPDPQKNLLRDVFGVRFVAEHFGHGADDPVLVRFDQFAEGFGIPFFDSLHPNEILLRGIGRGIGLGGRVVVHELEGDLLPGSVRNARTMQEQTAGWQRV